MLEIANAHRGIETVSIVDFAVTAFDAVWVGQQNMGDPEVVAQALAGKGFDVQALLELSQDPEVKAELIARTEQAVELGAFGAPTLFMDGEMYFGQDRLDFVGEALQGAFLPP